MYIWQKDGWPALHWDQQRLAKLLAQVSRDQGWLLGRMEALGFDLRREAHLHILTEEVVKSSEIEGEKLPPDQVRSSIARRLGMDVGGLGPVERDVEGIVEMMLDATGKYAEPLTEERLFGWHAAMFPTGRSGMRKIIVGAWRDDADGPMQVVSGPIGRERVHYEAPPAAHLPDEMERFLRWFEEPGEMDPLFIAGLAHLWFVTIHPFADGNGRIARAIADMALARSERIGQRFYSMSAHIQKERKSYYETLERTQKAELEITAWQEWFLGCLHRAIGSAQDTLSTVLAKARFWERFSQETLNARQVTMLNRLLDGGLQGKLTTSKWAKMTKCSQDTANRDVADLMARGVLQREGGGRSTSYSLIRDDNAPRGSGG